MNQPAAPPLTPSYGAVFRTKGFRPLLTMALLSRTALMMATVAFVLFALQRFHSPLVAGLTVFLLVFPGLAMSPINGALLDRFGRTRMMALDLTLASVSLLVIAVLAWSGALTAIEMLLIVGVASATGTLSSGGTRALFPLLVPKSLWERANAADVICYGVAAIIGPALGGALIEWVSGPATLALIAVVYAAAALPLLSVPDPPVQRTSSLSVLRDARAGIAYLARSRSLRWLAITLCLVNAGWGIVTVAMPLAVLAHGGGPGVVGSVFALEGVVAAPAAMLGGRLDTRGRERTLISIGVAVTGAVTLLLLVPSLPVLFISLGLIGAANGPLNVALFALRQRRTAPAWFGRVFAISVSLNYAGMPVGAAVAGAIAARSLTAALLLAAALPLVAAVFVWNIPRDETPAGGIHVAPVPEQALAGLAYADQPVAPATANGASQ
jgi:MFS family permease